MEPSKNSDDRVDQDSFSVPHNNYTEGMEFDSSKLDFDNEVEPFKIINASKNASEQSKVGLDDSRALSDINKMYDVLQTEKSTIFNLENEMGENYQLQHENTDSQMFGIEEESKLGEHEKVKIVNTIITNQGGSKHTDYKIIGLIGNEQFTIKRRYKEFSLLHKRLEERWPGFYIPSIAK